MESGSDWSPRETVIVVMDANRNKVIVDALDWALKHVVRPRDTVVVLGVFCKTGKKSSSCFPLNMGISIHGIWEKLDFTISSVLAEVKPRVLGEEIERKMEQYRVSVQPFYKQCKRNEVKLEMKLAVGLSPGEITITEAQNSKTRGIVLDSYLKKCRFFIYGHMGCSVALMKGKDVATLIPSSASKPENSTRNQTENHQIKEPDAPPQQQDSSIPPPPPPECPGWYPLQWRNGFPREFSLGEITEITNGLADENLMLETENMKVYEAILKEHLF